MDDSALTIAVMAYNRPAHLRNCIGSVLRHSRAARVLVIDDDSDDPRQLALLAELRADPRIAVLGGVAARQPHGGLYANMQRALEGCETRFLMFLQDDTQLVRALDAGVMAAIGQGLAPEEVGFLSPFFLKWNRLAQWRLTLRPDPEGRVLRPVGRLRGKPRFQYSDICVVDADRLRRRGWRFGPTEAEMGLRAGGMFAGMAFMADPVGFYCPAVATVFRDRQVTGAAPSAAEGDDPPVTLADLTPAEVARLGGRPPRLLPIAEDWLHTRPVPVARPFSFTSRAPRLRAQLGYGLYRLGRRLRGG